ncbi:MAG: hypothetical protein ACHQ9S_17785 [Candidatus Binatia bacterium]
MRPLPVLAVALFLAGCATEPRGACNPDPPPGTVGAICGFANPEDVEVVPSAGLLLVSQMRRGSSGGSLAALPLDPTAQRGARPRRLWPTGDRTRDVGAAGGLVGDPSCMQPPAPDQFAPHGLTSAPGETAGVVRIAVVGHGVREAIELFDLAGAGDSAVMSWHGCVPLPPNMVGNDVSLAPDGEIVVSNYMPAMAGWIGLYYTIKGGLGMNTGDVMAWSREHAWRHLAGTESPSPNGVFASRDGTTAFYAETGTGRISRVPRAGASAGHPPEQVTIGGNPDNLSLSPRGTILAATHTDGAAFLLCALGRLPCRTGWSIFEIDPVSLRATLLLHHDGSVVGGVASAAEFDGRIYFGAVFDDRIGVWRRM